MSKEMLEENIKVSFRPIQNHDVGNIFWEIVEAGIYGYLTLNKKLGGPFGIRFEKGEVAEQDCLILYYTGEHGAGIAKIYSYELLIVKGDVRAWLLEKMQEAEKDYQNYLQGGEIGNTRKLVSND